MGGLTGVIESDLVPLVARIAPLLGSVLGTPLAGVAVSLIAQAFGVHPAKIDEIARVVSNDPEAEIKLKTLELQHSETLVKIASSDYATEVDDRKNARANATLYKDFLRHMAYLVTAGFFGALIVLFLPLPFNSDEKELLSMLIGMLVSKWQTIIDFFYGSSHPHHGGYKNGKSRR